MGLQIMKIPSAMEVVPRYRLLVHCLHCFHCVHVCISYTYFVFLTVILSWSVSERYWDGQMCS